MPAKIDVNQIQKAVRNSVPISIKTYTLPKETEEYLEKILNIFLTEFGQEELTDRIAYCMKELAVNAKKANTKRVYFIDKGLDLDNAEEYSKGMENFKQETLDNINFWLAKQKDHGLYIRVIFQAKGKTFTMTVKNNVEISRKEQIRVYDRIARSRAFNSMEEALSTVLDDSEGAGLGIVILVLMLKKLGLDEDAFDIDVENGETVAKITIPFNEVHAESLSELSREIVKEIELLPQFPDNITYLQNLISDPESEIAEIARQISMDPSLTADLLKLVNSAQYVLPKRVDNIAEAVKLVGMRGLKNLLYSYGTQQILSSDQKWLWDHSYQTAYYAYFLARTFRLKKDLLDDAYVGGILHDMGKIIFSNVHPSLLDKIKSFTNKKQLKRDFLEDLSAGLNHAEIGALIAEKWNFPPGLVESIRCHHEPSNCNPEFQDVVYTVYLANTLSNIETGDIVYEQVEQPALDFFNIKSHEQFIKVHEKLKFSFQQRMEEL
jgi:putative nucleotidyltransferase with HDIG domain